MKHSLLFNFSVDKENKTINIQREFNANLELVWKAWTEATLLDLWWAPKPYRSQTKSMNFEEGGFRLYAMISPENQEHWAREDYQKIEYSKSFAATKTFCDEIGHIAKETPSSFWNHNFTQGAGKTRVTIDIQYDKVSDLERIMEMGFKEGFTTDLMQLDNVLETLKNK